MLHVAGVAAPVAAAAAAAALPAAGGAALATRLADAIFATAIGTLAPRNALAAVAAANAAAATPATVHCRLGQPRRLHNGRLCVVCHWAHVLHRQRRYWCNLGVSALRSVHCCELVHNHRACRRLYWNVQRWLRVLAHRRRCMHRGWIGRAVPVRRQPAQH